MHGIFVTFVSCFARSLHKNLVYTSYVATIKVPSMHYIIMRSNHFIRGSSSLDPRIGCGPAAVRIHARTNFCWVRQVLFGSGLDPDPFYSQKMRAPLLPACSVSLLLRFPEKPLTAAWNQAASLELWMHRGLISALHYLVRLAAHFNSARKADTQGSMSWLHLGKSIPCN